MVLINVSNTKFNLGLTRQDIITPAIILVLDILIDIDTIDTITGILADVNLITVTCKPGPLGPGFLLFAITKIETYLKPFWKGF